MLLSAVCVLVVAQSSSEIPEGLLNNPVHCISMSMSSDEEDIFIMWRMRRRLKEETLDHFVQDDTGTF